MGRTPDYLNVTFACFAGRADVWARRGNEQGAANLVAYQKLMRDRDLSTTHSIMNPQVDRSKPEAEQAMGEVALHKVGETAERHRRPRRPDAGHAGAVRRRADGLPRARTSGRRTATTRWPSPSRWATPGLKFICRDSYSKQRSAFDYPLSSRFDEMDAVAIFDDVEIPHDRVFLVRRHGGLLRGDHRHRLARPHHAPGVHARLRQALVRVRPRPHDRRTRPASSASTTSRRSSARSGTWSS